VLRIYDVKTIPSGKGSN